MSSRRRGRPFKPEPIQRAAQVAQRSFQAKPTPTRSSPATPSPKAVLQRTSRWSGRSVGLGAARRANPPL
jgi:hypothetical protein